MRTFTIVEASPFGLPTGRFSDIVCFTPLYDIPENIIYYRKPICVVDNSLTCFKYLWEGASGTGIALVCCV